MSKVLCIYHKGCADGQWSAWAVRKALGDDAVEFFAGVYPKEPPDVAGRDVLLVDFSYKRAVMERIVAAAASVKIIDHHVTAIDDLAGLHGAECVFDLEHSGAMLTWTHYFPTTEPPAIIRHVEDRDLWRFALPHTREISAALYSYPFDFSIYDELVRESVDALIVEGAAIERQNQQNVERLVRASKRYMTIGGVSVPVANAPFYMASDAGHMLAKDAPFAATYHDFAEGRTYSLRSAQGGTDVSEIAKRYGGGGHKHAAGFTLPIGVEP